MIEQQTMIHPSYSRISPNEYYRKQETCQGFKKPTESCHRVCQSNDVVQKKNGKTERKKEGRRRRRNQMLLLKRCDTISVLPTGLVALNMNSKIMGMVESMRQSTASCRCRHDALPNITVPVVCQHAY
jgi:hypothetical protein